MPVATAPVRRGTTLPELLVALMLFGVVGIACLQALRMSARWYERATLVAEQRAQVEATRRLVGDLPAAVSPGDGDFLAVARADLTWRATVGSAVVCRVVGGSAVVPRAALVTGVDLAAFASAPQPGDLLVALDDGPLASPADDRWGVHGIQAVHASTGGCVGGPLADPAADASSPAWRLDLSPPLAPADSGAPARVLRVQRLALYPASGEWMLGFTELNPLTGWAVIQPATGPLAPAAVRGGGLELEFVDSLMTASTASIAAVRVRLRAPLRRAARSLPGAAAAPIDSSGFTLAIRNRR